MQNSDMFHRLSQSYVPRRGGKGGLLGHSKSQSQESDEDEEEERGDEGVLDGGGEYRERDERQLQQQRRAGPGERGRQRHRRRVGWLRVSSSPPDLRQRRERRALPPLLLPLLRRGPTFAAASVRARATARRRRRRRRGRRVEGGVGLREMGWGSGGRRRRGRRKGGARVPATAAIGGVEVELELSGGGKWVGESGGQLTPCGASTWRSSDWEWTVQINSSDSNTP